MTWEEEEETDRKGQMWHLNIIQYKKTNTDKCADLRGMCVR